MNIKDYRSKELVWYVTTNVAMLFLSAGIANGINKQIFDNFFSSTVLILNTATITAIFYSFTFITNSLFTTSMKNKILYLGFMHLAGDTIFSEIQAKDDCDYRFTKQNALDIYKHIYENMPTKKHLKHKYENSQWYKIYTQHRENTMVEVSNRDYLLCRDMYIATINTIIIYLVVSLALNAILFDARYVIYLAIMLIATNVISRNKCKAFSYNVIALDFGKKSDERRQKK